MSRPYISKPQGGSPFPAPMSSKPETHRIEHKRELTPELDLEKEVIACLNTPEGGLIFIGIDKSGQPVGVADQRVSHARPAHAHVHTHSQTLARTHADMRT